MLKIFGKIPNTDLEGTVDPDCVQTCFKAFDCILAYFDTSGRCQLFNFNDTETLEVEESTKADGLFVAFKTTLLSDTCPAHSLIEPVVNIGEDPITWKKSGTTFSFQRCVGDWKMFRRSNPEITVCMQVHGIKSGVNQTEATRFCEDMGYKVTGVASVEESRWLKKRFLEIYPKADNWQAIWIDGVRNCTGENNSECDKFDWSDRYTVGVEALVTGNAWFSYNRGSTPENCLGVISNSGTSVSLNDIPCGRGSGLELGVACGYQMLA
ncbi:hypothetical protein GCK72_021325 [Caenorhabditis remanei]|uniref:PAN-3 domain-containing protein n=1 Tax=Caenorhabditis remanei TaxID=31234 RepID=A0A6A5GJJ8_CAERE|nr:hypothetical protein GCK72_021325 [Caenorhabditis remanei]KAF1754761.1 hypothetical protein GCK72_021325 [Caenorhabditis remanei]